MSGCLLIFNHLDDCQILMDVAIIHHYHGVLCWKRVHVIKQPLNEFHESPVLNEPSTILNASIPLREIAGKIGYLAISSASESQYH